jgi:signal transduction histidine kinase
MNFFNQDAVVDRARLLLVCACAWLGILPAWGDPAGAPVEINTFRQLYSLASEPARKGMPVRIQGVVLCYDPGWNQLYVHDGAETVWFSPTLFQTNLQAGLKIEITGVTAFGQGSATLSNPHLQILGPGKIPAAKRVEISQLGGDFGQWIEIAGRVRVAETSLGRLCLLVHDQGQTCQVYVMGLPATNDFRGLRDCRVRIRGINGSKTVEGRLDTASVLAPDRNAITVLERPGTQPVDPPVIAIENLFDRELGSWTNTPVHLNGLVVACQPGESVVVKDSTGSIRARVIQTDEVQIDSHIDLWGYLTVSPEETFLRDAYFEVSQPSAMIPSPVLMREPVTEKSDQHQEITRFSEVSRLRPKEAAQGLRVRLLGTVTYADPDWRIGFVQGRGTGAVCVDLNQPDVRVGQWVEVTGQTSPGGFAPQVVNASLRILATTNLPVPVKTDLEDLAFGNLDSHWVQLEGVVRRTTGQWGHVTLLLTTPQGRFKVIVLTPSDQAMPAHLVDALVSVQGVCTSEMNSLGQLTGIILHAPSWGQIKILEPVPADPFAVPARAIRSVATFDPNRLAGRRVKVSGSVTHVVPNLGFYVQDASGGIRVNRVQTNDLQVGDTVDILGFPAINDFSPYLEEVSFRRTGSALLPPPQPATAEEILLQGTHNATLVQMEGQLVQSTVGSAHPKLVLQSGAIIFTATLANRRPDQKIPAWPPGSVLRLVGVCSIQGGENHEPATFRLLVAEPRDVVLLRPPPWWTPRHTLVLAVSLALGLLLAWGWNSTLRRQVKAQTSIIRRNEQELMKVSHQAGRAEVATAVLHNVGNVLNSVNVSALIAVDKLRESKTADVSLVAAMMTEHAADLGQFMTQNPKGRLLPNYLTHLSRYLVEENRAVLGELESLVNHVHHIKDIVAMQQSYAKVGGLVETVKVADLIEDALQMNASALERHDIQLVREYGLAGSVEITVEKHKVLQILVNLISNANNACAESGQPQKRLTILVTHGKGWVHISFADNGVGILHENLTCIFTHGFTTRKDGHGFGLHSASLAAHELGGALRVQSEGPGKGATFTLELPWSPTQP